MFKKWRLCEEFKISFHSDIRVVSKAKVGLIITQSKVEEIRVIMLNLTEYDTRRYCFEQFQIQ